MQAIYREILQADPSCDLPADRLRTDQNNHKIHKPE